MAYWQENEASVGSGYRRILEFSEHGTFAKKTADVGGSHLTHKKLCVFQLTEPEREITRSFRVRITML